MTCIVGYIDKENRKIIMGGDSAGVSGLDVRIRKDPKVFILKDMIIGYTSSFRMGQLLRFKLVVPENFRDDIYEYMCTDFIDAVRKCFKENGYTTIKDNTEEVGTFLVGYKGRLFKIENDLQVAEVTDNYDACGCGQSYALGALKVLDFYSRERYDISEIIKISLEIATAFSGGVRPPYTILEQSF